MGLPASPSCSHLAACAGMQAHLEAASSLLGACLLPRLQLRDLQAMMQASTQLRSVVAAAPETAWRQAAQRSTSMYHPMLRSDGVHAFLQQRAQLQAAVADASGRHSSQPVTLARVLSPDLQLTARLEQSGEPVLRRFDDDSAQHSFPICLGAFNVDSGLLSLISWSHSGACVCCIVIPWGQLAGAAPMRVHICRTADSSTSTWTTPQDAC